MSEKNFFSGLEYLVLLIIIRYSNKAYGVPIHEEICKQTHKNVAYGAIYKALKGLASKGFISSYKGEATPERGGRAKTYYKIEAQGMRALKEYEYYIQKIKMAFPQMVPGSVV